MKKNIFMIILMITFGIVPWAFATQVDVNGTTATTTGTIDLDGAGGMGNISVTNGGLIYYSSAVTAGGYGGTAAGDQYCVNTASASAAMDIALEFAMRGSEGQEDNNLYQNKLSGSGSVPVIGDMSGADIDPSGWSVRGQ